MICMYKTLANWVGGYILLREKKEKSKTGIMQHGSWKGKLWKRQGKVKENGRIKQRILATATVIMSYYKLQIRCEGVWLG